MKTLTQVNQEIKALLSTDPKSPDANSARKKLKALNDQRLFLETNPTEKSITDEIDRLSNLVNSKMSQFKDWEINTGTPRSLSKTQKMTIFKKELGIPDIQKRIKYLNSFLNG